MQYQNPDEKRWVFLKKPNASSTINYYNTVYLDTWKVIFDSITRLIAIEEDLGGEHLEALRELNKIAEYVKEKSSKRF